MTTRLRLFHLTPETRPRLLSILGALRLPEEGLAVEVKAWERTRSLRSNRRYWALLRDVAQYVPDEDGALHGAEYWHHRLKIEFGYVTGESITMPGGFEIPIPKTTTRMSKREFGELMTRVEVFAAEHGVFASNWSV